MKKSELRQIIREEIQKLTEASGKDIAAKMKKFPTMKSFIPKVAKMKTVTAKEMEDILPDYIPGRDLYSLFD